MKKGLTIALLAFCSLASPAQAQPPAIPSAFSPTFLNDLNRADRAGRQYRIAKVGDSNSEYLQNFYGLGCQEIELFSYARLRSTLDLYLKSPAPGAVCRAVNTFSRRSAATRAGSSSGWSLKRARTVPSDLGDPLCRDPDETVLGCEIRVSNARITLISTGTNDHRYGLTLQQTRDNLIRLIKLARANNSAPILTTVPQIRVTQLTGPESKDLALNEMIISTAARTGTPVINVWLALSRLPNTGRLSDGIHLSYPEGDPLSTSVDFSPEGLQYGANTRNLLLLQTIDAVERRYKLAVRQ